ncbi:hypothetical protein [Bacteroides sp. 51]|uniref:hypothetical protein n=1 Tax=Bacteroides sp. 51 TaxID=2302938 RepID=UPI0013D39AC7|nr:hypothetical protein [Bacteroides sp. 51]NDV81947.1 hypothetical protein [Bacteroides sp. 51]
MKRFASHYLYIPSYGFLKQYVVEVNNDGHVTALYPLREESESIIWTPGVILLVTPEWLTKIEEWQGSIIFEHKQIKTELPVEYNNMASIELAAVRLYPFDFTQMQPTGSTIIQILGNRIS